MGSDASLNSLNVTTNVTAQSFTGSFSGSFTAPGATTQVVYNNGGVLAASSNFVFSGSNVGIGTNSPVAKLDVTIGEGSAGFNKGINIVSGNGTYTTGHGGILQFQNEDVITAGIRGVRDPGSWASSLLFYTHTSGVGNTFGTTFTEKMRIADGGNVGIGTTSPSAKLHVYTGNGVGIPLIIDGSNSSDGTIAKFGRGIGGAEKNFYISSTNNQYINLGTEGDFRFKVGVTADQPYATGVSAMVITAAGSVGIGTSSPSEKLEVQGSAQIGNDSVASAGLVFARKNSNQAKSHYFLSAQESPTYQWIEGGYFTSELAGVSIANNSGKPYYESYSPAGQYKSFGFINQTTSGSSFTNTAVTASLILYQGGNIALAPTLGNVGIGITNPYGRLEIQQSSTYDGLYISNSTSARNAFGIWHTGGVGHIETTYLGGGGAYTPISIDTSGTSRIYIETGGNVGIGTTSPSAKLEIAGFSTGAGLKLNYGNSSGTIEVVNFIANGGANGVIGMQMVSAGVGDLWLGGSGGRSLTLYRDGNVGIGTTSPSQKLDVAGAISVSGSVIDYKSTAALIAGSTTTNVVSFTPGTTKAAFIDYMIIDSSTGTNQRVGTIMVSISLNTVSAVINEITTVDIGNTAAVRFGVSYGPPVQITATNTGITPYDIKYMVRYF